MESQASSWTAVASEPRRRLVWCPPFRVFESVGEPAELAPHIASHMDVNAIVDGAGVPEISAQLQAGVATNLKRYSNHALPEADWFTERGEDPYWILDTVEMKTAWHPIGL